MYSSFYGSYALKSVILERVETHREKGELTKQHYWKDGKGCAIGCTIHSSNHYNYPDMLGIPVEIAFLEDALFEQLPQNRAMFFPGDVIRSIPVGVDLSNVAWQYFHWILTDAQPIIFAKEYPIPPEILSVAALVQARIDGKEIDFEAIEKAKDACSAAIKNCYDQKEWRRKACAYRAAFYIAEVLIASKRALVVSAINNVIGALTIQYWIRLPGITDDEWLLWAEEEKARQSECILLFGEKFIDLLQTG